MVIGRSEELARIERLLAGARLGTSEALVITGEPGIGKTALLGGAVERAHGMTVLRAAGVESESEIPFAGLLTLLRPVLGRVGDLRGSVARRLGLAPGAAGDRFLVGAANLTLLTACAEDAPVPVAIDDAQWLDESSLAAGAHLHGRRRRRAAPAGRDRVPGRGSVRRPGAAGLGRDRRAVAARRRAPPRADPAGDRHRPRTGSGGRAAVPALARRARRGHVGPAARGGRALRGGARDRTGHVALRLAGGPRLRARAPGPRRRGARARGSSGSRSSSCGRSTRWPSSSSAAATSTPPPASSRPRRASWTGAASPTPTSRPRPSSPGSAATPGWSATGAGRFMDFETDEPEAIALQIGRDVSYLPVETGGAARAARLVAELL